MRLSLCLRQTMGGLRELDSLVESGLGVAENPDDTVI